MISTSIVYFRTRVTDTSDTNPRATRTTRVRQECYMNDTSVTQAKIFDFDNDSSENIFHYTANERLQGEEQFHSKNYRLKMPRSHAKMYLKIAPQKLNFLMEKVIISKSYTLDYNRKCPCTFPHSFGK